MLFLSRGTQHKALSFELPNAIEGSGPVSDFSSIILVIEFRKVKRKVFARCLVMCSVDASLAVSEKPSTVLVVTVRSVFLSWRAYSSAP